MTTFPEAPRAIVYVRISQDRSGEAAGVTRQREDGEALVALRGWTLVAVHQDNDVSAAGKRTRPGFDAALADVEAGRADVLVAWSLDRLTRNRRDELRMVEVCQRREARIALVRGADIDLSTPAGRLVADVLGSVARHEIDAKSDRQERANLQAARSGRRVGGRRPFGYEQDGVTVREGEAAAIRDGYASLLAGVPLAAIARQWNDAGHRTGQNSRTTGKPSLWRADSVRATLTNPRYAGQRRYLREVVGPAAWPALVEDHTFAAATALLADPGRRNAPGTGRALLTGLGLCGVCGATVHGGRTRYKDRTYRCSASVGHFVRSAEPVEEYVGAIIVARLARPDAADLLAAQDEDRPDLGALRAEGVALRARLDEVAVSFADGILTAAQLRAITERVRVRLAEVEQAQADAGRVDVLGPLVAAEDVEATWRDLDVARQRAVVATLARVRLLAPGRGTRTFRPDSVVVDWISA